MPSASFHTMLVVDAGNSAVKFAVVTRMDAKPRIIASVAMDKLTASHVRAICRRVGARSAAASCVVPRVAKILRGGCPCLSLIGRGTALNFTTPVDRRTVGADRLANMAEAKQRFGKSVIVADFGTAATFDVLDARGRFAGGAIAPGLHTLADSLALNTAQLPRIDAGTPQTFIGRNTRAALRAGVCGGYAGLVTHLLAGLGAGKKHVIFTGGDAAAVAKLIPHKVIIDPLWTLKGVAVLGASMARETSK